MSTDAPAPSRRVWKWIGVLVAGLLTIAVLCERSIRLQLLERYEGTDVLQREGWRRTVFDLISTGLNPPEWEVNGPMSDLWGVSRFCRVTTDDDGDGDALILWVNAIRISSFDRLQERENVLQIRSVHSSGKVVFDCEVPDILSPHGVIESIRLGDSRDHGFPFLEFTTRTFMRRERWYYSWSDRSETRASLVRVEAAHDGRLIRGIVPISRDSARTAEFDIEVDLYKICEYEQLDITAHTLLTQLKGDNPRRRLDALTLIATIASLSRHPDGMFDQFVLAPDILRTVEELRRSPEADSLLRRLSESSDPWVRESALLAIERLGASRTPEDSAAAQTVTEGDSQ